MKAVNETNNQLMLIIQYIVVHIVGYYR